MLSFTQNRISSKTCGVLCRVDTHLLGQTKDGVVGTSLVEDISQEMFLTIVGGEDGNAFRRIALESHVHEQSHSILCFS